jgi:hypothetical protein
MPPAQSDQSNQNTATANLVSLLVEYFQELRAVSLDYQRADRERQIAEQRLSELSLCGHPLLNRPTRRAGRVLHAKHRSRGTTPPISLLRARAARLS